MDERERERENRVDTAKINLILSLSTVNPAVVIRSRVQYVLAGHSTTLEARVFASPAESAVVQWYHEGRLIDDANETDYTINSRGDICMLTVDSVSKDKIGRYTVVVILNGVNVTDQISLEFPGSCSNSKSIDTILYIDTI